MKHSYSSGYRKTAQPLPPRDHEPTAPGEYDMFPAYSLREGKIEQGFLQLGSHLLGHSRIVIDGYVGVLWDHFRAQLDQALQSYGVLTEWISVANALRPAQEIDALIDPFLGGEDPIFGKRFTGRFTDFFEPSFLTPNTDLEILQ